MREIKVHDMSLYTIQGIDTLSIDDRYSRRHAAYASCVPIEIHRAVAHVCGWTIISIALMSINDSAETYEIRTIACDDCVTDVEDMAMYPWDYEVAVEKSTSCTFKQDAVRELYKAAMCRTNG